MGRKRTAINATEKESIEEIEQRVRTEEGQKWSARIFRALELATSPDLFPDLVLKTPEDVESFFKEMIARLRRLENHRLTEMGRELLDMLGCNLNGDYLNNPDQLVTIFAVALRGYRERKEGDVVTRLEKARGDAFLEVIGQLRSEF